MNAVSTTLVTRMELATTKHPHPYRLHWFNEGGDVRVYRQALVSF